MREYISAQENPLQNLISTTAILLLSSVITETTAFSLKHEALLSNNRNSNSEPTEAIATVTGVSLPILNSAMSLFGPIDGIAADWPISSVLNSGKVLPTPEHFDSSKPFLPNRPFGLSPQYGKPSAEEKNPGILPTPPELTEPLQITVIDPNDLQHNPVEPEVILDEPIAPIDVEIPETAVHFSPEVTQPVVNDSFVPMESQDELQSHFSDHFLAALFDLSQQHLHPYPTHGNSQKVSMAVTGNQADFAISNQVNLHINAEGGSSKHFFTSGKPSSPTTLGAEHDTDKGTTHHKIQFKNPHQNH